MTDKPMPHMCRDGHTEIRHALSDDDERCPVCRERQRAEAAEAENERLRGMIDRMTGAANELVAAALPHCPKDRRLGQAWKRMRGTIPIQLVCSASPASSDRGVR